MRDRSALSTGRVTVFYFWNSDAARPCLSLFFYVSSSVWGVPLCFSVPRALQPFFSSLNIRYKHRLQHWPPPVTNGAGRYLSLCAGQFCQTLGFYVVFASNGGLSASFSRISLICLLHNLVTATHAVLQKRRARMQTGLVTCRIAPAWQAIIVILRASPYNAYAKRRLVMIEHKCSLVTEWRFFFVIGGWDAVAACSRKGPTRLAFSGVLHDSVQCLVRGSHSPLVQDHALLVIIETGFGILPMNFKYVGVY